MNSIPKTQIAKLGLVEFVTLLALMMSIVALATDLMLPALDLIGEELGVVDPNQPQLLVSALFFGFAIGQIIMGPVSDSVGRKPVVYAGYVIFMTGCLMSYFSTEFSVMLAGRVLQGLGAAGPRVVTTAIVRDDYEGRAMAKIMSIVMSIFILVPAIAPAIGQWIILLAGWRATFGFLFLLSVITFIWFGVRQPETLLCANKRPFSLSNIGLGIVEVSRIPAAVGYSLCAGLIFGAFLGYLSTAQQIFVVTYEKGELFPFYFGLAALATGLASVVNARIVMRLGMRLLCRAGYVVIIITSSLFLIWVLQNSGRPPFSWFLIWLLVTFFCTGILFGNLNALAMEPLGHFSGLGAAYVGSISTLISLPFGWFIGDQFAGGVTALVSGFAILSGVALLVMYWIEKTKVA